MSDETTLEDQLAEAQAQIESLQSAAADAEARAATLQERLTDAEAELTRLRSTEDTAQARLSEAEAAAEAARRDLETTGAELEETRSRLRDAALRYREARLASIPEVPSDLVPESDTLEQIERDFEAAQRVVEDLRSRLQQTNEEGRRSTVVPAGSPPRRAPDTSSLSASEKIRLGLQQRSEGG